MSFLRVSVRIFQILYNKVKNKSICFIVQYLQNPLCEGEPVGAAVLKSKLPTSSEDAHYLWPSNLFPQYAIKKLLYMGVRTSKKCPQQQFLRAETETISVFINRKMHELSPSCAGEDCTQEDTSEREPQR